MTDSTEFKSLLRLFKALIIAVCLAVFLQTFVFATSIVDGESMEPTLEHGERLIFNKLVYMFDNPSRGDVVIIQHATKNYVKRIIGLPGETIETRNHRLFIDGEQYKQHFLTEETLYHSWDFGPYYIPEDSYFVMGDNRGISKDSRNGLGFIKRDEIIGRSEIIIYPFEELGKIK